MAERWLTKAGGSVVSVTVQLQVSFQVVGTKRCLLGIICLLLEWPFEQIHGTPAPKNSSDEDVPACPHCSAWGWILLRAGMALPLPSPLGCGSPSMGWGGSREAGSPFAEPATAPRVRRCRIRPIALHPLNRLLSGGVSPGSAEDPFLQAGLWGAGPDATQLSPSSPAEISPLGNKTSPRGERTSAEPPPFLFIPAASPAQRERETARVSPRICHGSFQMNTLHVGRAIKCSSKPFPGLPLQSLPAEQTIKKTQLCVFP